MFLEIDPQTLLKIGSTIVTGNSPINVDPQTLLKIGSTNVTQNWFHKRYSKQTHKCFLELIPQVLVKINFKRYSKLVPQMLLKIGFPNITEN